MTIGERVKRARELRGLGVNELDRLMGRSLGFTSRLQRSDRDPRRDTLMALAEVLNVRVEWLASGDGPMVEALETDEYPHREAAIAQAGNRWLPETISTLETVRWSSDVDPSVRRWVQLGDQIDASFRLGLEEPGEADDEPDEELPAAKKRK